MEYINDLHISVKMWEKLLECFSHEEKSTSITATILEITEEVRVFNIFPFVTTLNCKPTLIYLCYI